LDASDLNLIRAKGLVMATQDMDKIVLVLQGGGALGSYQAGAYEALAAAGYRPEWLAGISIGAINSAIIAGNPPNRRLDHLRKFWEMVSSRLLYRPIANDDVYRKIFNQTSAAMVATSGVPGFFEPRIPPPIFQLPGSTGAISFYDTSPLRNTLLELIDFDLLNSGKTRLSVGAVNVSTGNFAYFDTKTQTIRPEHIMASGALPPGFPPIEIDGEAYWDGGLVSNTPLQYVLDGSGPREDMCVFQVDLFSARGKMPETLLDVGQREKEIRYSSRTRMNTDAFRELQTLRRAVRRVMREIPNPLKNSLDWQLLNALSCDAAITIVHLIHRRAVYETQTNDFEFSRQSIEENWQAGCQDVEETFAHPAWKTRKRPTEGVMVLDLTRDRSGEREEAAGQ
jgi:NTE family protein